MDRQRHSLAEDARIVTDPAEIAAIESENALRQFDRALDLIDDVVRGGKPFKLRPSIILDLHRLAVAGLTAYAGMYRPGGVAIGDSRHVTPAAHLVAGMIEDMCDEINARFATTSALSLCAYAMWRLNWIHPFTDGNGRTSRALAYYILCAKLGSQLPGRLTICEQIADDRAPYYLALEDADARQAEGNEDLSALEKLLSESLARQLLSAFEAASTPGGDVAADRKFH